MKRRECHLEPKRLLYSREASRFERKSLTRIEESVSFGTQEASTRTGNLWEQKSLARKKGLNFFGKRKAFEEKRVAFVAEEAFFRKGELLEQKSLTREKKHLEQKSLTTIQDFQKESKSHFEKRHVL